MNHFLLRLFIVLNVLLGFSAHSKINSCKEAKTGGACSDIVDTAINICEDKQDGKDITSSRLKKAQETKFDKNSDFSKMISEYKEIESSSKKEASNQKACKEAAKALKNDCEDLCKDGKLSSCDQGVDALNDIEKFCKNGEEAAEQVAEMASEDVALLEAGSNYDYSGSSGEGSGSGTTYTDNSTNIYNMGNGTGDSGTSSSSPIKLTQDSNENVAGAKGYIMKKVHPDSAENSSNSSLSGNQDVLDRLKNRLKDTSELASANSNAIGDLESAMNKGLEASNTANKNSADSDLSRGLDGSLSSLKGSGSADDSALNAAKAATGTSYVPGYMLWGTPTRKKTAMKIY